MKQPENPGSDDTTLLLTINEVAQQLRISRATVYRRLLDTKAITPVRIGTSPRIRRSDLDEYLRRAA